MLHAYSAAAVRAAEEPLVASGQGPALMQRAATALAYAVMAQLRLRGGVYGARAGLLIGAGNNGADALYAGAALASRGVQVTALLTTSKTHQLALTAFLKAGGRVLTASEGVEKFLAQAPSYDALVDGLLGTGGRGALRDQQAAVVERLCQIDPGDRPTVIACDLPSGIDASTGEVPGPVLPADVTVTFGTAKTGLMAGPAEQLCGRLEIIDIGLTDIPEDAVLHRLEPADMARLLPLPTAASQKYTRGVAGIVAGSPAYPGAALLAVAAASACGPGMVRYLGDNSVSAKINQRNPEVVCSDGMPSDVHVQAWLVGPGLDGTPEQAARAHEAMASGLATVVDAGALALLGRALTSGAPEIDASRFILTPHAGELSAFLTQLGEPLTRSQIEAAPLSAAVLAAQITGATVLLKGPTTLIAAPNGTVFSQSDGTARLATAGSGDTLAGILVALLAMDVGAAAQSAGDALALTGALGTALHGRLAHVDPWAPLHAGQLASRIPAVWAGLVLAECTTF